MPVSNSAVADMLNLLGDLLEIEGADPYRVRAYHNGARVIASLPRSVADMVRSGEELTELPGIGKALSAKITEIVTTGRLTQLEQIGQRTPPELARMMTVSGLGPKRVGIFHKELGIATLADLEQAAKEHYIREIHGFGEKIEQDILEDLQGLEKDRQRIGLVVAEQIAEPLLSHLRSSLHVQRPVVAGSFRRRLETVGDLDVLATGRAGPAIMEHLARYEDVDKVLARGDTRATVLLKQGVQVDLRAVGEEEYGAALHYFTGSKAHVVAIRNLAVARGLKINEYGVFRGEDKIAGETEEEIYALFGLPCFPPEIRENLGEIEAGREGRLPRLISVQDLCGDLQAHTKATDGQASIADMARAARARGYEYLAITDHSARLAMTRGLDAQRLGRQLEEIDRLNEQFHGFRILKGAEVDILEDGSLDFADEVLKQLDLTVCSVHSRFALSEEAQTERIIRAMDNPWFNILAHPTGRLIAQRRPYAVQMERLIAAARDRGCVLEIHAQPERLDLNDIHCKMAKDMGAKLVISTDAHSAADLSYVRFGVDQARRGWLEAKDVLNTRPLDELRALLKRS